MEHLGIAHQSVDMRFGKKIGRRGDQQYIGAFFIQRQTHRNAGFVFDILFQAFQRVGQRRLGQAEVVTDLVNLADNFVTVFLSDADASP